MKAHEMLLYHIGSWQLTTTSYVKPWNVSLTFLTVGNYFVRQFRKSLYDDFVGVSIRTCEPYSLSGVEEDIIWFRRVDCMERGYILLVPVPEYHRRILVNISYRNTTTCKIPSIEDSKFAIKHSITKSRGYDSWSFLSHSRQISKFLDFL